MAVEAAALLKVHEPTNMPINFYALSLSLSFSLSLFPTLKFTLTLTLFLINFFKIRVSGKGELIYICDQLVTCSSSKSKN